jgi:hypothetical protein
MLVLMCNLRNYPLLGNESSGIWDWNSNASLALCSSNLAGISADSFHRVDQGNGSYISKRSGSRQRRCMIDLLCVELFRSLCNYVKNQNGFNNDVACRKNN